MFYLNPTGCTIFFFLEKFFALHVLDVTCIHRQEHNCSVQPWVFFMVLVCLFHGAGTGVGTLCHFSTVSWI
jgi:hypothetical protein